MAKFRTYEARPITDLRGILRENASRFGTFRAFREKRDGIWQDVSFARFGEEAEALGAALSAEISPDTRVLIIGKSSYRWVLCYMALLCGAGIPVPADAECSPTQLAEIIKEAEVGLILYDKTAKELVKGLDIKSIAFEEIPRHLMAGRRALATKASDFRERAIDPTAPAALFFTPGTTGKGKGVLLSHENIAATLYGMGQMMRVNENDVFLSVLPLSHAYECICGFLAPLYFGATVAFCEGLDRILQNMRETHPTCMITIPLIAEALYRKCWDNIFRQGRETEVRRAIAISDPVRPLSVRQALKEKLLSRERALFGGLLRRILILGAPVEAAVQKGLRQLGVFAVQGYGVTECAGLAALNSDELYHDGMAGLALPEGMIDVYNAQPDGSGEIRVKGKNVMLGYIGDAARNGRALKNGWYYTGDIGRIDEEGFLSILGRRQNAITTRDGRLICPEELEHLLSQSPLIKEAAVVGALTPDGSDVVPVALIVPDTETAAEMVGIRGDLVSTGDAIDAFIADLNQSLHPYKQIPRYVMQNVPLPRDAAGRIERDKLSREI